MQRMVVPKVRAATNGLDDRCDNFRRSVSQQERAVSTEKVDVLVAVHVPFATANSTLDVQRHRLEMTKIVTDPASQHGASTLEPIRRHRPLGRVGVDEFLIF